MARINLRATRTLEQEALVQVDTPPDDLDPSDLEAWELREIFWALEDQGKVTWVEGQILEFDVEEA